MAIPKISKQDVISALEYIDKNGVPFHNQSTKYVLVADNGRRYPPVYVIAKAADLSGIKGITTESYTASEARDCLMELGFTVDSKFAKQEKFELTITADSVTSTDDRFTMDNLSLGDYYKPLDAYFKNAAGEITRRSYSKGERRNSNQTLPRIACQLYEEQLAKLSVEEKESFPICKYRTTSEMIRGIYPSIDAFKEHRHTIEYLTYMCLSIRNCIKRAPKSTVPGQHRFGF